MGQAKINILFLEDNILDAKAVIREINKWQRNTPVQIEHVERLAMALECLKKNKYDVIIADLNLGDSFGIETVKNLIELSPESPLVVLTGNTEEEQLALEAIQLGAQDYLFKDKLDGQLLMRVIRYAIERKQAKIMQELMKEKSEFISMVSHELRTPLAVIKESVEIVYDGTLGPINAEQSEFLANARTDIDRLTRLINNILDFQKLDSNNMPFQMRENDINALVKDIVKNFSLVAQHKGITLQTDLSEDNPSILCDRDRITQVLVNFMSNAIRVTEHGTITLKTKNLGNVLRVSVQDEGPGIKTTDFSKLFHVFSQLDGEAQRTQGATGLGLAISKEIIDAHKGKIGVDSILGEGATFYFLLPIRERRNQQEKDKS